jgi:3-dehydroquinate dehydratase II
VAENKESGMLRILLVQGANLVYLGKREPEVYGRTTPAELDAMLQEHAAAKGFELQIFYTNVEGEAINMIYQAADSGVDGLVMNPAGFTHAGYALRDCVKGCGLPYVEVHISNIDKRGIHSVLSVAAEGVIYGFGMHGYVLGLDAMLHLLSKKAPR